MNFKKTIAGVFAAATVFTVTSYVSEDNIAFFDNTSITAEAAINDIAIYYNNDIYSCDNIQYKLNKTTMEATLYGKTTRTSSGGTVTLTNVVIPNQVRVLNGDYKGTYKVTAINSKAFKGCELTSIDLSQCSSLVKINTEAFSECKKLKTVKLSSSISNIASSAFKSCTALNNFNFNGNSKITTLNTSVFYGCTALKSISIPYSVKWIKDSAFNSSGLTSVTIPNSVTSISLSAFAGCKSLETVKFEAGATGSNGLSLGRYAFSNCPNITAVHFDRRNITAYSNTFEKCGDSFKSYGYGAQDYTQSVCKELLSIWGLKYDPELTIDAQKEFFNKLQSNINGHVTYQDLDKFEEGCAATVISIRKGTCGGFARVFYNFCIAAGVSENNVLVGGDRHCHAWNYVKIGDFWYNIDATNLIGVSSNMKYREKMFGNKEPDNAPYYESSAGRKVNPHSPEDWIVCVDDFLGSDDSKNFTNVKTEFFDRLLKEGRAGSVAISGTRVNQTINIEKQPTDVSVEFGKKFSTTVTATGDGLTYQWYFKEYGEPEGAKFKKSSIITADYTTVMNKERSGRQVYCVITDKYGNSVQTDTVTLKSKVKITKDLVNVTAKFDEKVSFSVSATGHGLTYKWYYKNKDMKAFNVTNTFKTNTYSFDKITKERTGREVYCVITDIFGNSVQTKTIKIDLPTGYGDANCDGKLTEADYSTIQQSICNPDNFGLSEQGKINADVLGDDGVTLMDALSIQKYLSN